MKIRTAEELQEALDSDFAWRRKELTSIYTNVKTSRPVLHKTNLRIGVVMLYAHWEGFLKNAAEYYLVYVASKKLNYSELKHNFIALSLKSKLADFVENNKSTLHTQMVDFLLGDLNKRAQIPVVNVIKTQANLNSDVLRELISIIGLKFDPYELKSKLIDSQLLKIRNTVAHGQVLDMDDFEYGNLYYEITNLMATFKNDIVNCAAMTLYRK
jgi:hypothetical protein